MADPIGDKTAREADPRGGPPKTLIEVFIKKLIKSLIQDIINLHIIIPEAPYRKPKRLRLSRNPT